MFYNGFTIYQNSLLLSYFILLFILLKKAPAQSIYVQRQLLEWLGPPLQMTISLPCGVAACTTLCYMVHGVHVSWSQADGQIVTRVERYRSRLQGRNKEV